MIKITSEELQNLYKYLRSVTIDGTNLGAYRYTIIAKMFQRVAEGTASEEDAEITKDWMDEMQKDIESAKFEVELSSKLQAEEESKIANKKKENLIKLRSGKSENPRYQSFLDTLEQSELDALNDHVPYMSWITKMSAGANSSNVSLDDYINEHVKQNISSRLKETK